MKRWTKLQYYILYIYSIHIVLSLYIYVYIYIYGNVTMKPLYNYYIITRFLKNSVYWAITGLPDIEWQLVMHSSSCELQRNNSLKIQYMKQTHFKIFQHLPPSHLENLHIFTSSLRGPGFLLHGQCFIRLSIFSGALVYQLSSLILYL
jgi:hypothetical protein